MTDQEQYDKIEQYLNRRMSAEEQRAFERELEKDTRMKSSLTQQQSEHRAMEVLVAQDLRGRMAQWERKRTGFDRRPNYRIMALLILGCIAFAIFFIYKKNEPPALETPLQQETAPVQQTPAQLVPKDTTPVAVSEEPPSKTPEVPAPKKPDALLAIAQEFYVAPATDVFRSDQTEPASTFGLALTAFERQNYALALRELEKIEISNFPQADYLRGHIYFAQERFSLAAKAFEKTRLQGSLRYGEAAAWYQALCLVAQGERSKPEAIQLLETIVGDDQHPYYAPATQLLAKLHG